METWLSLSQIKMGGANLTFARKPTKKPSCMLYTTAFYFFWNGRFLPPRNLNTLSIVQNGPVWFVVVPDVVAKTAVIATLPSILGHCPNTQNYQVQAVVVALARVVALAPQLAGVAM